MHVQTQYGTVSIVALSLQNTCKAGKGQCQLSELSAVLCKLKSNQVVFKHITRKLFKASPSVLSVCFSVIFVS